MGKKCYFQSKQQLSLQDLYYALDDCDIPTQAAIAPFSESCHLPENITKHLFSCKTQYSYYYYHTLQKREVCAQLFDPPKCFKICHIYGKRKPMQFFSFFIQSNFEFYLINALVYVDIDQGIHKVKLKVALNEKRKKLHGLSFSINMTNFEAFWGVKKMSANFSFLKCEVPFNGTFP